MLCRFPLDRSRLDLAALAREKVEDGRVEGGENELARVLPHHHAEQDGDHGHVEEPAHAEPEGDRDVDDGIDGLRAHGRGVVPHPAPRIALAALQEAIADAMEHEDVPALAREVREERCDHKDYVLTEQQLVGTLHFPTCRGQKLRHANENAGKHLADETPLHDLRSLLASPKLPDHIGHEKGQEIAHDGTWDDDGRTEERESCHDGLCRHYVRDDERNGKDHAAEHEVSVCLLHRDSLVFMAGCCEQPPSPTRRICNTAAMIA